MKNALAPIVSTESKILILGTMPGERSLELQQYYGNRGNQFWKLMFTVLNEIFSEDYNIRMQLLQKHRIALWDVLASCERIGSLDSNIKNAVANDFKVFHETYPAITTVFFSSRQAAKFYDRFAGRKSGIEYFILPSPSGANATLNFSQKLERWQTIAALKSS